MNVTRRIFIASSSAVLAVCALGVSPGLARDYSIVDIGPVAGRETFDRLLVWASSKRASYICIAPDMCVTAEIDGRIMKITDRPMSASEIEDIVRDVYGENGVGEILAGFDLDPSHEIHVPGVGTKRYRVNMTGRIDGLGIQISARERLSARLA
jgi:defect-in-organelle-trafficking protein DotB